MPTTTALTVVNELTALINQREQLSAIQLAASLLVAGSNYAHLTPADKGVVITTAVDSSTVLTADEKELLKLCLSSMPTIAEVESETETCWSALKRCFGRASH